MTDPIPAAALESAPPRPACQNCGAALLGEHCYACGQPVKGLVRHFSSILGDFFDSVLNIDSRVFRTLGPLLFKPGRLSLEYFAGHRVRYVTPVRLFFFLSLITFFFAQLTLDFSDDVNLDDNDVIASATTVADVERRRDAALAELIKARADIPDQPGARVGIDVGIDRVRSEADSRIKALRAAQAKGEPPPAPDTDGFQFNQKGRWDAKTNPIAIDWLPGFANDWVNVQVGRAEGNVVRLKQDPNLLKDAVLSVVPSTLFVLLPVFALMLKLAYAFKRRLYMEHLIVALHSHAFLCLALLAMFVLIALEAWLGSASGVVKGAFDLAEAALWVWMPLYLLLMQKRVYAQGWPMTLLKFGVLGICYTVLLAFGAAFTTLAGLVWM